MRSSLWHGDLKGDTGAHPLFALNVQRAFRAIFEQQTAVDIGQSDVLAAFIQNAAVHFFDFRPGQADAIINDCKMCPSLSAAGPDLDAACRLKGSDAVAQAVFYKGRSEERRVGKEC